MAVARSTESGGWEMVGLLPFLTPRDWIPKETLKHARAYGIDVKMITGDQLLIAKETGRALEMVRTVMGVACGMPMDFSMVSGEVWENGKLIEKKVKPCNLKENYGDMCLAADGYHVIPEHKYLIVERLRELGYKVGMTVTESMTLRHESSRCGHCCRRRHGRRRSRLRHAADRARLAAIIDGIVIAREIFVRIRNFLPIG